MNNRIWLRNAGIAIGLAGATGFLIHSINSPDVKPQSNTHPRTSRALNTLESRSEDHLDYALVLGQDQKYFAKKLYSHDQPGLHSEQVKQGIEAIVDFRERGGDELIASRAFDLLVENPSTGNYFSEIMSAMTSFETQPDYVNKASRYFELVTSSDPEMKDTYLKYPFIFMSNSANMEGIPDCDGM